MSSKGVKYFPLDVCIDSKLESIENEFGIKGFAVVVKLFQRIYGQEGYYCEWNDEVMLSFATRTCLLGGSVVSEIVDSALRRGIFNKGVYDRYGVLTSKGIQERYLKITNRRKESVIKKEYLLINCTQNSENADNSSENVDIFDENADNSVIKELKELNELNELNKRNASAVFKSYQENIGSLSSVIVQKIMAWLDDVDESLIEYAIEQAVVSNKRSWAYVNAIVENHFKAGRKTRADAESFKPAKKSNNKFLNFQQPSADTASIEEALMKKRMNEKGII